MVLNWLPYLSIFFQSRPIHLWILNLLTYKNNSNSMHFQHLVTTPPSPPTTMITLCFSFYILPSLRTLCLLPVRTTSLHFAYILIFDLQDFLPGIFLLRMTQCCKVLQFKMSQVIVHHERYRAYGIQPLGNSPLRPQPPHTGSRAIVSNLPCPSALTISWERRCPAGRPQEKWWVRRNHTSSILPTIIFISFSLKYSIHFYFYFLDGAGKYFLSFYINSR